MNNRIALVTGANRGIGFEVARQLASRNVNVILGCRNIDDAVTAAESIRKETGKVVQYVSLNVADEKSISEATGKLLQEYGRLDILINNAAIFRDPSANSPDDLGDRSVFKAKTSAIVETFQTNTLGPLLLMQQLIPSMIQNNYGRVVNVSSGDGQLSNMNGAKPAYRISKVSLNALTKIFSDELSSTNVLVNSVCPGWVKTRMGGTGAKREVSDAVGTILWLATLEGGGPQGGFFRDFKSIPW